MIFLPRPLSRSVARLGPWLALLFLCLGCAGFNYLPPLASSPWQRVPLATEASLLDITFSTPNHGWLVGNNATLLESQDGGNTWRPRNLSLGEQNYRFAAVSFHGSEGWIAGQPALLLHTTNDGKDWSSVPLSNQLPGQPITVTAIGPQTVEMTTDVGAIYRSQDSGQNWKAMVQSAVGVVRNIARSPEGKYVAVSAKGNFYSTWEPGQDAWVPHNRNSSRRVQNMGFTEDGRLWMLARGGQLQFTSGSSPDSWEEASNPELATSWGLLDLAYRTPEELWVSGGGGDLLCSQDGGKTWLKDRSTENIPSNLYRVVFFSPNQGFILGQRGTLLKYQKT